MPLQTTVLAEGVLSDLYEWAQAQAASEGIDPADLVNRALERERRRLSGRPKLDSRTKIVGRKGADAKMKPGTYHGGDVAKLARVKYERIAWFVRVGVIASKRPTGRGVPAEYDLGDAIAVAVVDAAASVVGPDPDLAQSVGTLTRQHIDRPSTAILLAQALMGGPWTVHAVGAMSVSEQARRYDLAVAVNLSRIAANVRARAVGHDENEEHELANA